MIDSKGGANAAVISKYTIKNDDITQFIPDHLDHIIVDPGGNNYLQKNYTLDSVGGASKSLYNYLNISKGDNDMRPTIDAIEEASPNQGKFILTPINGIYNSFYTYRTYDTHKVIHLSNDAFTDEDDGIDPIDKLKLIYRTVLRVAKEKTPSSSIKIVTPLLFGGIFSGPFKRIIPNMTQIALEYVLAEDDLITGYEITILTYDTFGQVNATSVAIEGGGGGASPPESSGAIARARAEAEKAEAARTAAEAEAAKTKVIDELEEVFERLKVAEAKENAEARARVEAEARARDFSSFLLSGLFLGFSLVSGLTELSLDLFSDF